MKRIVLTGLTASLLALGGCVFAPGGNDNWNHDHDRTKPTVGQQLLDLDRARDKGVITDAEFERAKRDILDSAK
ncbi:MAG TPA: SHOCT domain-containing protein [Candidatus Acidoferrum sp.]|nr:SHOCT domain-containing protein [Candidatus Acidoferrum sp.]